MISEPTCLTLEEISFDGNREEFLDRVEARLARHDLTGEFLYRATEAEHLWKIYAFGTDRAGFPGKKEWPYSTSPVIFHEDVIIAATKKELLTAPVNRPTLFLNFIIRRDPVLLVYDPAWFSRLKGHHYRFIRKKNRTNSVKAVIPVHTSLKKKGESHDAATAAGYGFPEFDR